MSKNDKLPFTGMRDIYPNDMIVRDYIFNIFNKVATLFSFQKYDTPLIEPTSIYKLKNDDDIVKELFYFSCDGKEVCLRPEITPSLVRLASNMSIKVFPYPLKLYSIGQCFRFETVSKLRKREHYQLNCDIINYEYNLKDDAEILSLLVNIFKEFGFTSNDIVIKLSSRKAIDTIFTSFNLDDTSRLKLFNLIDKLEKMDIDTIRNSMLEYITNEQIDILFDIINNKKIDCDELKIVLEYLEYYEILDWIEIDYKLVRGLSYYTGIVFEAFAKDPLYKKSICGGGRYDSLGKKLKWGENFMVGFGFGDVVITDLLKEKTINEKIINNYLIIANDYREGIKTLKLVREYGYIADIYSKKLKNLSDAIAFANKKNFSNVIILDNDKIILKNMINKSQTECNIDELSTILKK